MLPADVPCSNFMVLEIVRSKFRSSFIVFLGNKNNKDRHWELLQVSVPGRQLQIFAFFMLGKERGVKILKSWSGFHKWIGFSLNGLSRRWILGSKKQHVCLLWYACICLASLWWAEGYCWLTFLQCQYPLTASVQFVILTYKRKKDRMPRITTFWLGFRRVFQ